jgi:glycosyltransferase involved in cell wall biosynthesis
MRIGIDARELSAQPTGVGRYLDSLLYEWLVSVDAAGDEFVLYWPSAAGPFGRDLGPRVRVSVVEGGRGTAWEQARLPHAANSDGLDVFFAPAYTSPLAIRAPVVQTVHDLSFLIHPEWFRWREGLRRRWLTRQSARRAEIVLTDTEFVAGQVLDLLGVHPARVRVVLPGVPRRDRSPDRPSAREPLVLFVGTILNRRHVPELIEAFARVARTRPEARLAIVGENRSHPAEDLEAIAAASGVGDRVAVRRYLSDAELDGLFARARAFVFLSEYEGFGLTPLEALSAGVPIVVRESPVAREVYGDAAVYVSGGDAAATAAVIERLLFEGPGPAAAVLHHAERVLPRYSWPRAARQTLAALGDAARARRAAAPVLR